MIILGVDPGLTRCGVGVIEAGANRRLSFMHVDVVRSDPHISQDLRLLTIYNGLAAKLDEFIPDAVSIERVFAQENRNTVLGTAQAAGMAMLAAAQRGIPVALHTPPNRNWPSPATARPRKSRWNAWWRACSTSTRCPHPPTPRMHWRSPSAMRCVRKARCRAVSVNSI